MSSKSSASEEVRSAITELLGRGEEVVNVFVEELTGSSSLRRELSKTLRRATRAKEAVDKNVEVLLGALNLPTRRDYSQLVEELHTLQGAVVNLNMKMDRLLAMQTAAQSPAGSTERGVGKGGSSRTVKKGRKAGATKKRAARKRA